MMNRLKFIYNREREAELNNLHYGRFLENAINRSLFNFVKATNRLERIVIVCYKPFPGKASALISLMKTHWKNLHAEGLVSDRKPILMTAQDDGY